jgi:hypothetical protein
MIQQQWQTLTIFQRHHGIRVPVDLPARPALRLPRRDSGGKGRYYPRDGSEIDVRIHTAG